MSQYVSECVTVRSRSLFVAILNFENNAVIGRKNPWIKSVRDFYRLKKLSCAWLLFLLGKEPCWSGNTICRCRALHLNFLFGRRE